MTMQLLEAEVLIEWTYSLRDFFESPSEIGASKYAIDMYSATASVRMPASEFDADPSVTDKLHAELFSRMQGVQLLRCKPFELSNASLTRIEPDGSRNISVKLESVVLTASVGLVDVIVTDASGEVVSDTKQERIERKRELAELVATFPGDTLLDSMLNSHAKSISDPNNELVNLYEVRDALATAFGGELGARSALDISTSDWRRLGRLANDEPLLQGRLRGQKFETLRDATEQELADARAIARRMLEAYLRYRDKGGKVQ